MQFKSSDHSIRKQGSGHSTSEQQVIDLESVLGIGLHQHSDTEPEQTSPQLKQVLEAKSEG